METMKAILGRRSIRKYIDKQVTDEQIRQLLEAAMAAPSGHNKQPWHFIEIRDKNTLLEIPKFHQYSKMLEQAPLCIVVCGDLDLDGGTGFWPQDCAAATQNILIAAKSMGLGTVWIGVYPQDHNIKGVRALLEVPERIVPFSLIAVGYAAEEKPPAKRYNEDRIHHNRW